MPTRAVLLITGASHGIGAATAVEFARRGYDCYLLDIDQQGLQKTANAVETAGGSVAYSVGDLCDLDVAQGAVFDCMQKFGRIDVLVNNAAWREIVTMKTISRKSWEKTLRVCLTAPAFLAREAARHMEAARAGVILNVSSIQSRFAAGISPAYVAAKGGLDALTYELATLYGPAGIRVVALNLGAVDTRLSADYITPDGESLADELRQTVEDMIPLGRYAQVEEIARSIAGLAGGDASYISGTCIEIDGGWFHQCSPYTLKHRQFPQEYPRR